MKIEEKFIIWEVIEVEGKSALIEIGHVTNKKIQPKIGHLLFIQTDMPLLISEVIRPTGHVGNVKVRLMASEGSIVSNLFKGQEVTVVSAKWGEAEKQDYEKENGLEDIYTKRNN